MVADEAIQAVEGLRKTQRDSVVFDSILNQVNFIRKHALERQNPVKMLGPSDEFTFGIISSREFASPEELKVKKKLDRVSVKLRELWEENN